MTDIPQRGRAQASDPYIVISGNGRSGSNRLLEMLDISRHTVCRSEVDKIPGSAFADGRGALFAEQLTGDRLTALQAAIAGAKIRRSARDRLSQSDKAYLSILGSRVLPVMEKGRLRAALARMGLMRHPGEWRIPGFCLRREALPETKLVLKLNDCPAWAAALVSRDANSRILHNIRDPQGYLQSWYNRFIHNGAEFRSFETHFPDVPKILAHFGCDDAERLRVPTLDHVVEVELWRWRFTNEALAALDTAPGQYLRITYAEIETDPLAAGAAVYGFAGLPFGAVEKCRIAAIKNRLFDTPHKTHLDRDLCARLINRVLDGSPLREIV